MKYAFQGVNNELLVLETISKGISTNFRRRMKTWKWSLRQILFRAILTDHGVKGRLLGTEEKRMQF